MIKSERESKLFRVIARQTLGRGDAVWLTDNIREGLDWHFAAKRAFEEGLAPVLYYHCRNVDLLAAIPESTKKFLARIYAETSIINMHFLKEMAELEKRLTERHLQVIVLKGAALLKTVYRNVALRPMEDIDLMVRQEHLTGLKNVLETIGFVQNRLYPGSYRKGILSMDLHPDFLSSHRIQSRRDILNIKSIDIWRSATPINESASLFQLSLYDNLIALSYHLLKHRYDRLIWFVDIAESIKEYQPVLNWPELIEYSRRVRADRILLYALLLMKHLTGFHVSDQVLIDLGKESLSHIEKYLLRLRLMQVPVGAAIDMLWIFQIPGVGKKIRFVRENIFPRREVMNQIFPDTSHNLRTFLRRALLVSSQVLSDFLLSARSAMKTGLPPL
ncbi:MAG: nucleotidyltransferase family protein [Deltaproteobacteria bacterium]|nr:nucleotidyltransferase family protein [Deltaproteobacteria bacterium]